MVPLEDMSTASRSHWLYHSDHTSRAYLEWSQHLPDFRCCVLVMSIESLLIRHGDLKTAKALPQSRNEHRGDL